MSKVIAVPTANGCFIDKGHVFVAGDGSLHNLEWTPTLNPGNELPWKKAVALAESCDLNGGGWRAPDPHELQSLVNYDRTRPASDVDGTESDWYWTGKAYSASPSDCAFVVHFSSGNVYWGIQNYLGFVRACRRVPASQ